MMPHFKVGKTLGFKSTYKCI